GPVCTPPPCQPGESYYCPGTCPGGCGTQCATPVPTTPIEGACIVGSSICDGPSKLIARADCCRLSRSGALPEAISWCPRDQLDALGHCGACADPCAEMPPPQP